MSDLEFLDPTVNQVDAPGNEPSQVFIPNILDDPVRSGLFGTTDSFLPVVDIVESADENSPPGESKGDILAFPERTPGPHPSGSEFFRDVLGIDPYGGRYQNGLEGVERELAILEQVEAGNIPDFLRHPRQVVLRDYNGNTAELSVMPDYLAIGNNDDWVRVPVTPLLAQAIADRYGMELPTRKVAEAIYDQADVRLAADPMRKSDADQPYMEGNGFYFEHNRLIESHLNGVSLDSLVAGHKKDIIVSDYAANNPYKLDFQGFYKANGEPYQKGGGGPHGTTYVDYSHGARFIAETVIVNGVPMRYADILRAPVFAGLLNHRDVAIDVDKIYQTPPPGYPQYSRIRASLN